ncbi:MULTISPECIES: hypothetical protein [Nostocales]|uniref:Uncharacterized protein n=1 Tax=Dolichospermum flos-aquae UHCC 0037 TaxID=2590026 RepID=A0ACC7S8B0_DOLFA|nr:MULTISPECIES: hypothetical protein [Nostocales]MBO1066312.1 hypothetical protein [Anabaena sp. 54]MTJ44753.1 hypothetical protein [Dolichospermum flos-aquae UHCC 0037]
MYLQSPTTKKLKIKGVIDNTSLIISAFSVVFYSRIFCSITRAPSIFNLTHFAVVPFVLGVVLFTSRTKDHKQIAITYSFLLGIFIFLVAVLASALWNNTGLINAIVSFMMLCEPFIFLLSIVCIPMSAESITRIKKWLIWSAVINFVLAAVQKPLIDAGKLYANGFNGTDGCGGVFFVSGAGNYVSASVSVAFALYFFINEKTFPLWMRIGAVIAAFWQILFSDSKQLLLAYLVAWVLLVLVNSKDFGKTIKLLSAIALFGFGFLWCVQNLEAFAGFTAWARPELYGADGYAWYTKFYSVRSILSHYQSSLDWLFGLGPGHTVSRLGVWFLRDYWSILGPLGATTNPISQEAMEFCGNSWLCMGSTLFMPIFGWAGIWGDLGLLGVGTYLFLSYLTWQHFGFNDSLKVTLLAVLVFGLIFTQMEEPGFMLSIAFILGLAWQERRLKKQRKQRSREKEFPNYQLPITNYL